MPTSIPGRVGCPEFRRTLARPDRRGFLTAGALGTAGLSLAELRIVTVELR